jgi:2'-5' RNA ligase
VALEPSKDVKARLIKIQERFSGLKGVKLTEPENLHFTLKFLGELDEKTVTRVVQRLEEIAKKERVFNLHVRNVGVFPNMKFIRIVWTGGPELYDLQKTIHDCLSDVSKPEKHIKPHLTIARVKTRQSVKRVKELVEELKDVDVGKMPVTEIVLKKSVLTPSGPVYSNIRTFRLCNQDSDQSAE